MTTYEKTWQFDINRVPSQPTLAVQNAYLWWYIKAFLMGQVGGTSGAGLWTCLGSGNGTNSPSAPALDGTDRWGGATFSAGNMLSNNSGSAHSWITLQSPSGMGPYYLTIDLNSQYAYQATLVVSRTAPTTGFSTTARPTDPSDAIVLNGGTTQLAQSSFTYGMRYHGLLASDGSFFILTSCDGTGKFTSAFGIHLLADTRSGDDNKLVFITDPFTTSGVLSRSSLTSSGTARSRARNKDNTVSLTCPWAFPSYNSGTAIFATNEMGGPDATDGCFDDFPVYVFADTIGSKSVKGRLQDIMWAPEGLPHGFSEPASGVTSMVVGNFWFPSNAQPKL